MTIEQYAALVRTMRKAQDAYFRSRRSDNLTAAVKAEAEVDKATAEVLGGGSQLTLFDPQPRDGGQRL